VTFVAGGRAWAVSPDEPATPTCLFEVDDPGSFSWGPRGDRVTLAGLEVRGVGTQISRPRIRTQPTYFSWSRPTGTTMIFTSGDRRSLLRADMGTSNTREITPVPDRTYGDMAYHPSGLAIGFAVSDATLAEIWMSTNLGTDPVPVIQADPATRFAHLVFSRDGTGLFYTIDRGGTHALARYDLTAGEADTSLWTGDEPVADIVELGGAPGLGLTIGAGCAAHRAVFTALDGSPDVRLAPGLEGPVSLVGRLDAERFVVAAGCGTQDLYVTGRSGGAPRLLVRSVEAAALRVPEPTPAPALPADLPRSGFA
jgi:hypothetical protein